MVQEIRPRINRIEEQIKDKILPLLKTGTVYSNYNFPHQIPEDLKVIKESCLPEFESRLEECRSSFIRSCVPLLIQMNLPQEFLLRSHRIS